MISAKAFRDFLFRLDRRVKHTHPAHNVEVTISMLEKSGVSMNDAKNILSILSKNPRLRCLEVIHYRELKYANDEYEQKEVFALVRVTPNFSGLFKTIDTYYDYKLNPKNKSIMNVGNEWQEIKNIAEGSAEIDWSSVKPDSQLIESTQTQKARINLVGNEIVLTLDDNRNLVIKKLRTDQAPLFFIRYLLLNPNQLITRTVIQTSVEMCAQKDDMTELVRQCGFNKSLKKYFFNGTSKTKVMLTTETKIPNEIVDKILV